jgi:hypothetical protein
MLTCPGGWRTEHPPAAQDADHEIAPEERFKIAMARQ